MAGPASAVTPAMLALLSFVFPEPRLFCGVLYLVWFYVLFLPRIFCLGRFSGKGDRSFLLRARAAGKAWRLKDEIRFLSEGADQVWNNPFQPPPSASSSVLCHETTTGLKPAALPARGISPDELLRRGPISQGVADFESGSASVCGCVRKCRRWLGPRLITRDMDVHLVACKCRGFKDMDIFEAARFNDSRLGRQHI